MLKPGGKAFVALYSTRSLHFINVIIKAVLRGNFRKRSIKKYISENTEQAWITKNNKNHLTDLFSPRQCKEMFGDFKEVQYRQAGTMWREIPKVGLFLERVLPKSFPPGISFLGGGNYIKATK